MKKGFYLLIISFCSFFLSCTSAGGVLDKLNPAGDSGNTSGSITLFVDSPLTGQMVPTNFTASGRVTGNQGAYCWVFIQEDNSDNRFVFLHDGIWASLNNCSYGVHTNKIYALDAEGNASPTNELVVEVVDFNNQRGIVFQPPALPGNPVGSASITNKIVLPAKQTNGTTYTAWRFDTNGDGVWDTAWTNSRVFSFKTPAGQLNIKAEARNSLICTAFTNNLLSVSSGNFSGFPSTGSGNFNETNAGQLSVVNYSSVALGDIDADGDLDLILTGTSGGYISKIYRNDGSGSFAEINAGQLTGVQAGSAVLGDIDNDGDLDLILVGNTGTTRIAKIYQNNGSGSFTEINAGQLTGVYASSIALGDIDGDGDLDLIITGKDSAGTTAVSKIYRNNGSGSFTEINSGQLTGVSFSSIALGDIDGDGDLDLILSGVSVSSGYISKIYRNDGSGSFTEINSGQLTGVSDSSIVLGDIDGDGDLDLILSGYNGSTAISKIYRNDGSGNFTEINSGQLTGVYTASLALGDIDGDGDLDLILTGYNGSTFYSKIYRNDGSGSFTEINAGQLTPVGYSSIALGDIDGDGDNDLILTGYTTGFATVSKIYRNQ